MSYFHLYRRNVGVILVLLSLIVLSRPAVQAENLQVAPTASSLTITVSASTSPGSVVVTGEHFTPGGEVYVAIFDQWGTQLYEARWIDASIPVYGPNGSQDPAHGYSKGGDISQVFGAVETFYGPHGSQDPALGYCDGGDINQVFGAARPIYGPNGSADPAVGFGPDGDAVEIHSRVEPVYGLNGSQDPANGYVRTASGDEFFGNLCGTAIMVRAYDEQAATWSNILDINPGC